MFEPKTDAEIVLFILVISTIVIGVTVWGFVIFARWSKLDRRRAERVRQRLKQADQPDQPNKKSVP